MPTAVIASTNPVKINATKLAFKQFFQGAKFTYQSITVSSGVTDQPLSDRETLLGATNRCQAASIKVPSADYWVGIEGGIEIKSSTALSFAWIAIKSPSKLSTSRTATFNLPPKVVNLIKQGKELGDAMDHIHRLKNSKRKQGAVGILTKGLVTRTDYYHQALTLALIPFANPKASS